MAAEYFTFDLEDGRTAGLVRRKGVTIEAVQGGEWVDDPNLLRFFEGFWGDQIDLVPLSADEARTRATELDVDLDQLAIKRLRASIESLREERERGRSTPRTGTTLSLIRGGRDDG